MKKRFALAVLAASLACTSAPASAYTTIFAFGDSLSDAGNAYVLDGFKAPVYPYYPGHFSNGPTWVEDLSVKLKLGQLKPSYQYGYYGHDYAVGGAQTGTTALEGFSPRDLPTQIALFAAQHYPAAGGALFTLDIGANDIFGALSAAPGNINLANSVVYAAERNTITDIKALYALGARSLLFYDVPDLGRTPLFYNKPLQYLATFYSGWFDQQLLKDLVPLENAGLKVFDLDTYDLVDNPNYFGTPFGITFTDVSDPCWTGNFTSTSPCSTTLAGQNKYLFWDAVHPTAAGHLLTADYAACTLTSNCPVLPLMASFVADRPTAVPEPSTWAMMLLSFVGSGFATVLRRRKAILAGQVSLQRLTSAANTGKG